MVLYSHTSLVSLTKTLKNMFGHLIRDMVGEKEQIILTGRKYVVVKA